MLLTAPKIFMYVKANPKLNKSFFDISPKLPLVKNITVSTSLLRVPLSADSTLVIARAVQVFLLNIAEGWNKLQ